jgi:hypothetical protein
MLPSAPGPTTRASCATNCASSLSPEAELSLETEPLVKEEEVETEPLVKEVETEPLVKEEEVETEPLVKEVETEPLVKEVETEPLVKEVETEPLVKEEEVEARLDGDCDDVPDAALLFFLNLPFNIELVSPGSGGKGSIRWRHQWLVILKWVGPNIP